MSTTPAQQGATESLSRRGAPHRMPVIPETNQHSPKGGEKQVLVRKLSQLSPAQRRQVVDSSGVLRPGPSVVNSPWIVIPTVLALASLSTLRFLGYFISHEMNVRQLVAGFCPRCWGM
jgi:hypothetical protein